MDLMILPVINAKNIRRYLGLAEDKKPMRKHRLTFVIAAG